MELLHFILVFSICSLAVDISFIVKNKTKSGLAYLDGYCFTWSCINAILIALCTTYIDLIFGIIVYISISWTFKKQIREAAESISKPIKMERME